jgi:cell fate regulator YaaT (PSP1 superfamily)
MSDPAQGPGEPPAGQDPIEASAENGGVSAAPAKQAPPTLVARYGMMRSIGEFRHNFESPPRPGTHIVVRTDRGVELAEVVSGVCAEGRAGCVTPQHLAEFLEANQPDYPFRRNGKALRLANAQDIIDQRHLEGSAEEEAKFCRQQIDELALEMRLVTVEHLLGGERIIFYFSAESRIDFRELVRRLAAQFRTRIEMRQVGARDEARLVADYERCGRRCCCQQFLKDLKPVSMRMAKIQKATLDPSKISGRCGRLMCCLRYEDAGYEELRAKLPRKNTWVRTESITGRVVDVQILTQLVRLAVADGAQVVVANEEIVERDVAPPPPAAAQTTERPGKAPPPRPPAEAPAEATGAAGDEQPAAATASSGPRRSPDKEADKTKKGRRRRRRKSRKQTPSATKTPSPQDASSKAAKSSKKRKGRPRRRKKT